MRDVGTFAIFAAFDLQFPAPLLSRALKKKFL